MSSKSAHRLLTISVDDGHPADMRVADMLARVGLTATFYVPERNPERPVIDPAQVRELAAQFEIGSHTLNHLVLTKLPATAAWNEIYRSKLWVEDTVSHPSVAFCYPRGKHNRSLADMARKAGFHGARTVMLNLTGVPQNPFRWGVSTHAHSHPLSVQIRHALREGNIVGLRSYAAAFQFSCRWDQHFRRALDQVECYGGIAHLFLHSWEIEDQKEWKLLFSVLEDAASRSQLRCITNGELFRNWNSLHLNQPLPRCVHLGASINNRA